MMSYNLKKGEQAQCAAICALFSKENTFFYSCSCSSDVPIEERPHFIRRKITTNAPGHSTSFRLFKATRGGGGGKSGIYAFFSFVFDAHNIHVHRTAFCHHPPFFTVPGPYPRTWMSRDTRRVLCVEVFEARCEIGTFIYDAHDLAPVFCQVRPNAVKVEHEHAGVNT
jgi:hypothetical protein